MPQEVLPTYLVYLRDAPRPYRVPRVKLITDDDFTATPFVTFYDAEDEMYAMFHMADVVSIVRAIE